MSAQTAVRTRLLPSLGFLVAVSVHAVWYATHVARATAWADLQAPPSHPLREYVLGGDVLLGVSYGAAAALALHGVCKMAANRRAGAVGAVGGLSLGAIVAILGCFLVGCCGSPMLAVWAGLFGAHALGGGKFVTAGLTLASVGVGWWWLRRSCAGDCCGGVYPKEDRAS